MMLEAVQGIGKQVCEWYDAPFLLFSENVFSNLIYYSHIFPAIVAILLGTLIFFSDRKRLLNKVMFFVMAAFTLWSLTDLMLWATEKIDVIMFAWSSLAYLEILIYLGCLYLVHLFVYRADMPFKSKAILFASLLPVIFLAPTAFNLTGFDFTNCEREAIEGPLWYYIYALELAIVIAIAWTGIKSHRKFKEKELRKQNALIVTGILLFLISFSFGNIIGSFSLDWSVAQYGLFGMPVFSALLAYLIVRYQRFNTKVFTTQILTTTLWVLILSILLVQDIQLVHIIVGFTLVLSIVFGNLLNVSVAREIKQKEELQKLNDRLRDLDKQKTEFVSFATHQIRSPLTSIKGNAAMMLEGDYGPVSGSLKEAAQTMLISIKTLGNVVEDYLNISRIELGTMRYDMKQMDFKTLLTEVVNEQKTNIEAKGLTYAVNVDESQTYRIKADPDKFKQVIMNIIDNSVKYTARGSINISLEKDSSRGTIKFAARDTGVGIAPDVMPKLFQKFSRAKNASESNIHGTGLGLFIAKEIVQAHGGRMWAESEGEGKGSQFYVEVPEVK